MFRLQDISIKRKLMLIIMAASVVAILFVSAGLCAYELITHRKAMTHDLSTLAEILGNEGTSALSFNDTERATEILDALNAKEHIVSAAFYKNGQLFAHYPELAAVESVPKAPEPAGSRFEDRHLVLFQSVQLKGETIGTIYLKSDLGEMRDRFTRYATIIFFIIVASVILVSLLSIPLQRIISRPIYHLVDTAKAVSDQKNYSLRANKHGNDELGQLIDGFNAMLGQIQERDVELKQMNEKLEKRVQERTQHLRSEIAERRQAQSSLQQQFKRLSLLNHITQVISERQDLGSIMRVVLRQLEDNLHVDFGCVALFDPKTELLNFISLRLKNTHLTEKIGIHEGITLTLGDAGMKLCHEGQMVYISDTVKGPAMLIEKLGWAGLRSAVAAPLIVEGKLFGVLFTARLKVDAYSEGDREFLQMLSAHVALAGHQAKLYAERERAYNELRQTQQAVMQQERLKALGQMASGIAHDVNNALSPVVGFADLMLRGDFGLSADGKKFMHHIKTAGQDIAHIVARLREFYRKRDDRESLQLLNLNHLAEQVADMTRPRWRDIPQSNGVTVEMVTEFGADVPELVGIESEIREAFTNLVLNSVDALPTGGKITLCTRGSWLNVATKRDCPPTHVIVEVSDNGIGMNEETRRRCLEPFFSTKGRRGTGLGLAMVYGVMQRHEGTIEIDSTLGKGTTFRLIFPVRKELTAQIPQAVAPATVRPLQILCIDDEPLVRELLKELLARDGHTVEVSDGGQSGIDEFRLARERGRPFDIVITDLGMPYVDGRQVAKTLKSESPDTPVVMLTGWGAFMKDEGDQPAQVDGVIAKPPRSKELHDTIARLANQKQQR